MGLPLALRVREIRKKQNMLIFSSRIAFPLLVVSRRHKWWKEGEGVKKVHSHAIMWYSHQQLGVLKVLKQTIDFKTQALELQVPH